MTYRLKLTEAQVSALACAWLDPDDAGDALVAACWHHTKAGDGAIVFDDENRIALHAAITELSNGEFEFARKQERRSESARLARGAALALRYLATKIITAKVRT